MREFRDPSGVAWVVFLTARGASAVARDERIPEAYRHGWLVFESKTGEKRRLAPVPNDWESLSDEALAVLCQQAVPDVRRGRTRADEPLQLQTVEAQVLEPQLHDVEVRLSHALGEVCELPEPAKLNTGELVRVEETLAVAVEAAKEAVSIRRRLRSGRKRDVSDHERPDTHG